MNTRSAKVLKQLLMDSSWNYKEVKNWSFTKSISAIKSIFSSGDDLQY